MLQIRVIPCLQLIGDSLVKTEKFKNPRYIGDPVNTVRIFNELEVDELCFLDIRATLENREPPMEILSQICNECFMPLSYGGGINSFETAKKIFAMGFEKIVLNSSAYNNLQLITELSKHFGAQAIIGSIDVKKNLLGKYNVFIHDGTKKIETDPVAWALKLQEAGVGEILITSIDRDGTWKGFDLEITKKISEAVNVPVIANGGAGKVADIGEVVNKGKASAVCLGSMVVYQQKDMGVLINFPDKSELKKMLHIK